MKFDAPRLHLPEVACMRSTPLHSCQIRLYAGARAAAAALLAGMALFATAEASHAQARVDAWAKRGDQPLSLALWAPPPGGPPWVYNEAQLGLPDAPFIFAGQTLYTAATFETARPIHIAEQAHIHTQDGTALHLSGDIANTGNARAGLLKSGPGTLMLTGRNSYRGNTIVLAGALHVAGDSAMGETNRTLDIFQGATLSYAPGAISYNATQLRAASEMSPDLRALASPAPADLADSVHLRVETGTAVQAGVINGTLPLVKWGAGRLHMPGFIMNSQLVTVAQGALAIDGFIGAPLRVQAGARLEGSGAAGAARIEDGATLAPGMDGSIATLSFMGDLDFAPGAVLEADVDADGRADLVQVMGAARLDGHVLALARDGGGWQPHTRYTLLRAEQGLEGSTFSSVASRLDFLTPTLGYDDQHVYLTLKRNETPLETAAGTPDEAEVATIIDHAGPPELRDQIIVMDKQEAGIALGQLSGHWHASLLSGLAEDSRYVREAALDHAWRRPMPTGSAQTHGWHHAFYSDARRAAQSGVQGDERQTHGIVMGVNKALNPAWNAGVFLAAQDSRYRRHPAMARARIESLHAGLTLAGSFKGADLAVGVARAWHALRSQRSIAVAGLQDMLAGNYSGRGMQVFTEIMAPLHKLGPALQKLAIDETATAVAPFVRLAWVKTSLNGYIEKGESAALALEPADSSVVFTTLGLKAEHHLETAGGQARLHAELAWRHAAGDTRAYSRQSFRDDGDGRLFGAQGLPIARQAWSLRLGVEGRLSRKTSVNVGYAGQYSRGRQDHGARMQLAWTF